MVPNHRESDHNWLSSVRRHNLCRLATEEREEGAGSKSVRNSQGSGSRVGVATEMTRMICKLEMEYHSQGV